MEVIRESLRHHEDSMETNQEAIIQGVVQSLEQVQLKIYFPTVI